MQCAETPATILPSENVRKIRECLQRLILQDNQESVDMARKIERLLSGRAN